MAEVRAIDQDDVPFRFGLFRGSEKVGQVDLLIEATVPNDDWLGALPPMEMFLAALELPWEDDWLAAGSDLLRGVIADLPPTTPAVLQANTNLEVHERPWRRVHLFEAVGFDLFQEKHGYLWVDRGEPLEVDIPTRTMEEIGDEAYRLIFSLIPARGLDRNDNYYYDGTGPQNWANVMMTMSSPEDRSSYFIGYEADKPVGMVGLSAFDEEGTGTISYIGVVPEHRGRGFGRRLLMADHICCPTAWLPPDPVRCRRAQHSHAGGDGCLRPSARSSPLAPLGPLAPDPLMRGRRFKVGRHVPLPSALWHSALGTCLWHSALGTRHSP